MKRLMLALASAAAIAAPLAMTAAPAAARDYGDRWDRRDDRWDRRGDRWDGRYDRRDYRYDRRDYRGDWDRGRHNGYYYQNRWYYGPPPQAYYGSPSYRPGYTAWRRGGYLPPVYRSYVVEDYYAYHLRPPPRGYRWYRVDNDYMLAAIATGLIYDIINDR